jgi:phenylacetate-coenzyme A ligase PaaK-like adenylate-forming protein
LDTFESFRSQLYEVNEHSFTNIARQLFTFQSVNNPVYKTYLSHLGRKDREIGALEDIPFMPISFFKQHSVKTGAWTDEAFFMSSGTTGETTSTHHIADLSFYLQHSERCFQHFFGPLTGFHFFALLPSYLERKNSSLVAMMDYFINRSKSSASGFYLKDTEKLLKDLAKIRNSGRKAVLFGVSFALLDLAERIQPDLSDVLIVETGGMKGRRKELTRSELHDTLRNGLNASEIYSEYGMTELLSQAYSSGKEHFRSPPWMKIIGRDITDPLQKGLHNETAGINVVDLANFHSIAFIETEDLGKVYRDGSFEVLGRMDNSDVRGCNLLLA